MTSSDIITDRIKESIQIKQRLLDDVVIIETMTNVFITCLKSGKRIYFFGNGGSAADAQHLAAEIVSKFYLERKGLPAEALNANTSIMTAIGNDYSFEKIFARQIEASGKDGDVAVGISTSGNSINVLEAVRVVRSKGMITVGFAGQTGGKLKSMVDYCFCAPSNDTPRIQEVHITVGHIICEIVEKAIFGAESGLS